MNFLSARSIFAFLFALCASLPLQGDVIINEIVTAASARSLQWDAAGTPKVGTGVSWVQPSFSDATWFSGPGPFGYGTMSGAPAFGTDVGTLMQYLTPTLYMRKAITVSAGDAARVDQVQLTVDYNDGFICYVNGVELVRRWAGPTKQFHYHDQPAYRPDVGRLAVATTGFYTETINLGAANVRLVAGVNVIAIQALNVGSTNTTFLMRASVNITGAPTVALVTQTDTWKYLPGVVEPSGSLYDPAQLFTGKLNVPWGTGSYDDSAWATGTGPIGAGSAVGTGKLVPGVIGVTPSIYLRKAFAVTAAQAADKSTMQLLVDYDDAFVAYVNGVEVARANIGAVPNTFTPSTAVANATRNNTGGQTVFLIDTPAHLLVEGQNVLAIQMANVAVNDPDIFLKADLRTNGGTFFVTNNTTWKYFPGTVEPVPTSDTGVEDSPSGPDFTNAWIELYNSGASAVSLTGWSLTDKASDETQWVFPVNVSIAAGGYLVVFCDGVNSDLRGAGGYLHTNFNLSRNGDYLALYDPNRALVQDFSPTFPRGSIFHSYGRNAGGSYVYFDTATPAAANAGAELSGFVASPTFSVTGGFYATSQSVALTTATAGATIRYTTDGSEPTATTGVLYSSAIAVSANVAIRARAFKSGMIPSSSTTNTYLINESVARKSVPAVCLAADTGRSLYRPYGIFAITNNVTPTNYSAGEWYAAGDASQFNNANLRGTFVERPGNVQFMQKVGTADPSGAAGFNIDAGFRCAGSPFSRPRYVFSWLNNGDPNSVSPYASSATEKPQINAFFRDDYGAQPLNYSVFPGAAVTSFDSLRFRSGKNDISNPFVRDELTRRLFIDTGNVGVHGIMSTLWINGVYKGYYNPVERPRESFFQNWYRSSKSWDVWVINDASSGDNLSLQELVTWVRSNPQNVLANYQGSLARLDMANFIDYLLVNIYEVMGDWPHNNYLMARERSTSAKWVFTVWDGEGSYGSFSTGNVRTNQFATATANTAVQNVIVSSDPASENLLYTIRILYTTLRNSPEFKLLFADRIQKQFFNNGPLTDARILARKNALRTEMLPLIPGFSDTGFNDWINGKGDITRYNNGANAPSRRQVLFSGYTDDTTSTFFPAHFAAEGLFPATLAPAFSQFGGAVAQGFQLTITNPNASGTIYYTTNGSDPRAVGGAAAGTTYTAPVALAQSSLVKARVLNGAEWSPLLEATFTISQLPALLITEIMYHPADVGTISGDNYEFIEIKNVGTTTLNMGGMKLADAVDFTFPSGTTIAPGAFKIVAKSNSSFTAAHPGIATAGSYSGSLSNSGQLLTLRDLSGVVIFSATYGTTNPWPTLPDGFGNSLVPILTDSNPTPNSPASWRASAIVGGSPGADDTTPYTPSVIINEVLANSPIGQKDSIELYNPTAQTMDLGGWFLSDSSATPKKYRIPEGTIIYAGGYLVFTEDQFNTGPTPFLLDANGEEARLTAADAVGNLTGYSHGFSFAASPEGVSFGRFVNSAGIESFPAQTAQSFGNANPGPTIGPVVITELMADPALGGDEFLELTNISTAAVPLFDPARPANTWRISGVSYTLPAGITLQPGQVMLITSLNPTDWRAKYGTSNTILIAGAFPGSLDNAGEKVALQMPGVPYLNASLQTLTPTIDVDVVNYLPTAPWPTGAASTGYTIERVNSHAYSDDPANWRLSIALGGSPGVPPPQGFAAWQSVYFPTPQSTTPGLAAAPATPAGSGLTDDPDGDGMVNLREFFHGLNPLGSDKNPLLTKLAMDGASGPYLTLQFRRSLTAQGVTFAVDTADNLANWSLGASVQIGAAINNGDGTETLSYRDLIPTSSGTQRFIRLRILGD